MLHQIAQAVGRLVAEIEDEIDEDEFQSWAEFFEWQEKRAGKLDFYMAQLAGYASGKPRFTIGEFMMERAKPMKWQDALAIVKATYAKPQSIPDRKH